MAAPFARLQFPVFSNQLPSLEIVKQRPACCLKTPFLLNKINPTANRENYMQTWASFF
jgi:hypothetical protein